VPRPGSRVVGYATVQGSRHFSSLQGFDLVTSLLQVRCTASKHRSYGGHELKESITGDHACGPLICPSMAVDHRASNAQGKGADFSSLGFESVI